MPRKKTPSEDNPKNPEVREKIAHKKPPEYFDFAFLLATVIAGAAITMAMDKYFRVSQNHSFIVTCDIMRTAIVVITTLRYFHGNIVWQKIAFSGDIAIGEELSSCAIIFKHLSSYYIHVFQYILFMAAGQSIDNFHLFVKVMLSISILDVLWTGKSIGYERNSILKRAVESWFGLNVVTTIACLGFLLFLDGPIKPGEEVWIINDYILFFIYGVVTAADYFINKELFFGIEPEKKSK